MHPNVAEGLYYVSPMGYSQAVTQHIFSVPRQWSGADMAKQLGPTFGEEVKAAGLGGLPFSWGATD